MYKIALISNIVNIECCDLLVLIVISFLFTL